MPKKKHQSPQSHAKEHAIDPGKSFVNKLLFQKLFLFAFAFIIYSNSLPNQFNLDDELYHNRATELAAMGYKGLVKAFTSPTFVEGNYVYERRPAALAIFIIQYRLLGSSPLVSHLINVLLYSLTCFFLFLLLRNWLGAQGGWLPFFIVLLFAAHPLHTEIVDSIKNRDDLLAFFFAVLSYLAAWKFYSATRYKLLFLLSALFFFLLAILSKRTIIPFFLVIPLSYFFFSKLPVKKVLLYVFVFFLPAVLFRALVPLMDLHRGYRQYFVHENPFYAIPGHIARLPTVLYVSGKYLLLHLFPYRLAYYYGSDYVPVVKWTNPFVWISAIVYLLIGWYLIRCCTRKTLAVFGVSIFILGIATYSNFFLLVPGIMAERHAYMSSLGFCVATCALSYELVKRGAITGRQWQLALASVVLLYGIRSMSRNTDWYDKVTLYTHDMAYLQSSAKANSLYGEVLANRAEEYHRDAAMSDSATYLLDQAKYHYRQALAIDSCFPNALNNLALIYVREDSLPQAKYYLLRSLKTTTNKARTYDDLGMIYMRGHYFDSAHHYFNRSIASDSLYLNAYCNLSKVMIELKDTADAEQILRNASAKDKESSIPYIQLADIALFKKDTAAMVLYCRKAAELKPANTAILSFLVGYYRGRGDIENERYYSIKFDALQR